MAGWIKLYRSLTDWEWYADKNTCRLFLHLLMTANHTSAIWRNCITVRPGERISSLEVLAAETSLTVMQVRTALKKLETTGEITRKTTNHFTVFQVQNWAKYQYDNTPDNTQNNSENSRPDNNYRISEEAKNDKNTLHARKALENKNTDTCFSFDDFWNMYGKKMDREKCNRKYAKLSEADRAVIKTKLPLYVQTTPELRYRKNPQTWLNGRCWLDELTTPIDECPPAEKDNPQWSENERDDDADQFF